MENKIGIIGGGNVAMDIGRILLEPNLLKTTCIDSRFLGTQKAKEIHYFIRRGPLDLPCTTRELRELFSRPVLNRVEIHGLENSLSSLDEYKKLQKSKKLPDRKTKRLLKVLADNADKKTNERSDKIVNFHFYTSPKIIEEHSDALFVKGVVIIQLK